MKVDTLLLRKYYCQEPVYDEVESLTAIRIVGSSNHWTKKSLSMSELQPDSIAIPKKFCLGYFYISVTKT